jgi:hypothetical protein
MSDKVEGIHKELGSVFDKNIKADFIPVRDSDIAGEDHWL